jgi:hypothetical protein
VVLTSGHANWVTFCIYFQTYYYVTTHVRLVKKVSYAADCGETSEAHPVRGCTVNVVTPIFSNSMFQIKLEIAFAN